MSLTLFLLFCVCHSQKLRITPAVTTCSPTPVPHQNTVGVFNETVIIPAGSIGDKRARAFSTIIISPTEVWPVHTTIVVVVRTVVTARPAPIPNPGIGRTGCTPVVTTPLLGCGVVGGEEGTAVRKLSAVVIERPGEAGVVLARV